MDKKNFEQTKKWYYELREEERRGQNNGCGIDDERLDENAIVVCDMINKHEHIVTIESCSHEEYVFVDALDGYYDELMEFLKSATDTSIWIDGMGFRIDCDFDKLLKKIRK